MLGKTGKDGGNSQDNEERREHRPGGSRQGPGIPASCRPIKTAVLTASAPGTDWVRAEDGIPKTLHRDPFSTFDHGFAD